ncbi:MAG TPA: hypothetical protein VN829_08510, partial [Dongiaceae bacterium]|nr:hypothetical protein [Dongiaceae bacterium]
ATAGDGAAYGYNALGFVDDGVAFQNFGLDNLPFPFLRGAEVAFPSEMVAVGDSCPQDFRGLFAYGSPILGPYDGTDYLLGYATVLNPPQNLRIADAGWIPRRHGGRWNFVFCDAHTENRRLKEMFDPSQGKVAQRWNRDHQPHPEIVTQQYPGVVPTP